MPSRPGRVPANWWKRSWRPNDIRRWDFGRVLAKAYPAERMEAAARRCLRARAYNFQSMDSILKNQLDRLPLSGDPPAQAAVEHDNIRGAGYFDSPPDILR